MEIKDKNSMDLRINSSIEEAKKVSTARNFVVTVILLFLVMQVPGLFFSIISVSFIGESYGRINSTTMAKAMATDEFLLATLFLTLLVSVVIYLFAKKFLNMNKKSMGLTNPNAFSNYIKGLGIGVLVLGICIAILLILGQIEIVSNISNISLMMFILFIIGWILQGFEEELMCRAVLMNYFAAHSNLKVAIITNSLIFSILHIGNASFGLLPFINIYLIGVVFSLLFYISDDIFLPAAFHSMWNFIQGNILGISVSGSYSLSNTLFKTKFTGNDLLTGGGFGIEASLVVTVVEVIFIIILIKKAKDKSLAI